MSDLPNAEMNGFDSILARLPGYPTETLTPTRPEQ